MDRGPCLWWFTREPDSIVEVFDTLVAAFHNFMDGSVNSLTPELELQLQPNSGTSSITLVDDLKRDNARLIHSHLHDLDRLRVWPMFEQRDYRICRKASVALLHHHV